MKKMVSIFLLSLLASISIAASNQKISNQAATTPPDIQKIFNKPLYKNAKWGLRVVDLNTNEVLIDLNSADKFFIGSVRKIFSVGELLEASGPDYRSSTTVHHDGVINNGELKGNLVLVASGDLTMGGRTTFENKIDYTDYDHNEANSLGNAQLTQSDPLAGYKYLAAQVRKSGITKISGDVVIDDRLFDAFNFRNEFNVSPLFVNDDVVDVIIRPGSMTKNALVKWRPQSEAFKIVNNLITAKENAKYNLELKPLLPQCIGKLNCSGEINGNIPVNFIPPLTDSLPLIQTFRITKPANYGRSVFIEALREAGVNVDGIEVVKENPVALLKPSSFYNQKNQITSMQSLPYGEHAKYILKVSYNIGADTSLVLLGLTKGVRNMADSLRIEKDLLKNKYGISTDNINFIDGSGGGNTMATNTAVTAWLNVMAKSDSYISFFDALPILSVDGSLSFVKNYQSNPSLAGAMGKVRAKTGTYLQDNILKGQALAGYVVTKNNNRLIFQLVVNNVTIDSLKDVLNVFQDQGEIAAILWRDY
jgi:D-alanyl-D-alanine carboxypeptidase